MLQTQTVEPGTLSLLRQLMQLESSRTCALVGGTALSLVYGHRLSIDLDLFSTEPLNMPKLINELSDVFGSTFEYSEGADNVGIFLFYP